MIKIGKLADYALLITNFLAQNNEGTLYTNNEISRKTHLPEATVRKLLKKLVDAKIVSSFRGNAGGYRLSDSPDKISLVQVINAIEGTISITECAIDEQSCNYIEHCQLKHNWQVINQFFVNTFSNISLADMSQNISQAYVSDLSMRQ